MNKVSVLVVEDNAVMARAVSQILAAEGYEVAVAADGQSAEEALARGAFGVVFLDLGLPDTTGDVLLGKWVKTFPEMPVIVLTAERELTTAVSCLKAGAFDFLVKPAGREMLLKALNGATRHMALSKRVTVLTQLAKREDPSLTTGVITVSPAMRRVLDIVQQIAASDYSCVLIRGESGVGKGLLARALHTMSQRRDRSFVELNCSAMTATLVESELFGHQKGSFTDAKENRIGVFEMADGGTLFLDEIGDMDITLQAKLLKVIEEQRFRRVGGTAEIRVNVAVIAATNQDIMKRVVEGSFRSDLYYRLHVIPVEIPPLRERQEDIPLLAAHFLDHYAKRFGKPITGISAAAYAAFQSYSWPGNVRELRNVIERACLLAQHQSIDVSELMLPGDHPAIASATRTTLAAMPLARAEELAIRLAMEAARGNRSAAANILQIHRTTLGRKLREYGLDRVEAADAASVA